MTTCSITFVLLQITKAANLSAITISSSNDSQDLDKSSSMNFDIAVNYNKSASLNIHESIVSEKDSLCNRLSKISEINSVSNESWNKTMEDENDNDSSETIQKFTKQVSTTRETDLTVKRQLLFSSKYARLR